MDKLNEKIKNKRVAILGPADYVNKELNDDHGEFINNFDTVIRLNSMVKLPNKDLEKYYGTKFDILVSGFWPFNDFKNVIKNREINYSRYLQVDNYKDISENLLIFDFSTEAYHKKYVYDKNKDFFDKNKHITFFSFPFNFINILRSKFNIKKSPTTGFTAILLCILLQAKEIYVSGVSFFSDNKHLAYYDNYEMIEKKKLHELYNNEKHIFDGKKWKWLPTGHNFYNEADIFRKLYKKYNIKIDDYLKNILGL